MKFETIDELMEYSQKIVGKSINDIVKDNENFEDHHKMKKTKGILGNLVETEFYHYPQNNNPSADFEELGVELKITGIIKTNKGYRAKERLVLTMINFMSIVEESFENSHLFKKNKLLLILWYTYIKGVDHKDFIFNYVFLYSLNRDRKIIENDFNIIKNKVLQGKAHELSEGDTTYLGACRKGRKGSDTRKQPYSDIPAPSRAFCLKNKYMTLLLDELMDNDFNLLNEKKENKYLSVLDYINQKLKPYFNKSQLEIAEEIGIDVKDKIPKNLNKLISDKLIGKDNELKDIDEIFKYSTYKIKNSPIYADNKPKERMSFPNLKLSHFNDSWENSFWKGYFEEISIINIRYHFEKSSSKNGTGILQDIKQFAFTDEDLNSMKKTFNMIRKARKSYENKEFGDDMDRYVELLPTPKSFENQILEILPKATKGPNSYHTLLENDKNSTKVAFALTKEFIYNKFNN